MKPAKDNFSEQSDSYARFRPGYPEDLYQWIFARMQSFERAWDCGTGNGQVARRLADQFDSVLGTDISEAQLSHAPARENLVYRVSRAEQTDLPDDFFDLITVAQALHWFDFEAFFAEAKRVARPGAMLACWCYQLCRLEDDIDPYIHRFYHETVGPYWDPERHHIDAGYSDISFPFDPLPTPDFRQEMIWTTDDMEGFLHSWSAVRHFRNQTGEDPVRPFMAELTPKWGPDRKRKVTFPLILKVGNM